MTKDTIFRLRRILGAATGVSIATAGVCLMAACLGIYQNGDGAFSREAVAAAFGPIAVPVYLCLALVIAGFILHLCFPAEKKKTSPAKQNEQILNRLHARTDLVRCGKELLNAIDAEQYGRRSRKRIRGFSIFLCALIFIVYILTADRFLLPDINRSMLDAMAVLLPWLVLVFGYSVYTEYRNRKSIEAEIELMRQAAAHAPKAAEPRQNSRTSDRDANRFRTAILVVAVAILIYGFVSGGTADVLTKAINICTECVGLG